MFEQFVLGVQNFLNFKTLYIENESTDVYDAIIWQPLFKNNLLF